MVYLRETIALTRSSELQEMYAAFIVAVANNYWSESSKKRLSSKLLEIASSSNSDQNVVIDVYTSVSACFEIFANEIHEAEKREKEMKRKKRQTPSTMRKSRVEIACSKTNLKEQEKLVLNALKEYATDRSFETRRRERMIYTKQVYSYWNRLRRKRRVNRVRARDTSKGLWIRDTHEDRQRRCLVFRKSYRDVSDLLKPHSSTMSTTTQKKRATTMTEDMLSLSRTLSLGGGSNVQDNEEEMKRAVAEVDEDEMLPEHDLVDEDEAQSPSLKDEEEETFQDEDDEEDCEPLRETRCVFVRLSGEIEGTFRLWST